MKRQRQNGMEFLQTASVCSTDDSAETEFRVDSKLSPVGTLWLVTT